MNNGGPKWTHDGLMADLAGHLRAGSNGRQDLQLGPAGSPRPDGFTINKSFMHPCQTAYECKISVADFRSDVTSGKWMKYLDMLARSSLRFHPGSLVKMMSQTLWLILRHENAWRLAKKPVRQMWRATARSRAQAVDRWR